MGEGRHTHYRDSINTPPSLTHEHHRGLEGHGHTEEIEEAIARMLHAYSRLTPRGQRIVSVGIAAMRRACYEVATLTDDTARRYPPPTVGELRAPLVNRRKGEDQTAHRPSSADPWEPSSAAICGSCRRQSRRRVNATTRVPYGPSVIFHADDCPDRPVGGRA